MKTGIYWQNPKYAVKPGRDFIFDPSLVLYLPLYRLDGASFMSKDAYGHLCSVTGALWTPQGRSFDGSDDYVDCGNIQDLAQEFTVELWSNRSGSTCSYGCLIGIDMTHWSDIGGFAIFDQNDGRIEARIRNASESASDFLNIETDVPNNLWRCYSVTWNKPTLTVYRNGAYVDSNTWNYDIAWNVFKTRIGRWGNIWFYGLIDEVRIYHRCLTPLEIQHNYLATKWRYQ